MKKNIAIFLILSILLCLISCNFGLGSEVDLEAPVISVDRMVSASLEVDKSVFATGIYCKKNVKFYGTANDNEEIKAVYTEIKWSDETEFHYFQPAKVNGNQWSIDINFEREGTAYLRFVVEDRRKNFGLNSSKVITLMVDENAPVGEAWYIDRKLNGIQYSLKDKEELKQIDLTLSENKDVAQNGTFAIRSSFNDTMGIAQGSIEIDICDEEDNLVYQFPNSSSSSYSPVFEITHDKLVEGKPELATGKHYLQIKYYAEDIVTVPDSNKAEGVLVDGGWFLWYPESDNPQITTKPAPEEVSKTINLKVEESVTLTLFDDDAISKAYCALLTEEEYNNLQEGWESNPTEIKPLESAEGFEERYKEYTAGESLERDTMIPLKALGTPQKMYLVAYLEEKNGKTCTIDIPVNVTDASSPILFISSPENNSIPTVEVSNDLTKAIMTITGQTLDTSGCKYLEFVWIPNSVATSNAEKKVLAEEYLETLIQETDHESLKDKKTDMGNGFVWSMNLGEQSDAGNGFTKQEFSTEIDLFSDFIYNEKDERNEDKYFLVKLTRNDGAVTYQEYKLSSDKEAPTIETDTPKTDMEIVPTLNDYTLKFRGVKESNLSMDTSKYKIERVDTGSAENLTAQSSYVDGYFQYTISKDALEEMAQNSIKPTYKFYATDLFGNTGVAQYTLVISDLPRLSSITSIAPSVCKVGDVITFNVNFTDTVSVDTTEGTKPSLKITGITDKDGNAITEVPYSSGSGTTTLSFSYTVKEGDFASKVTVNNEEGVGPIATNNNATLKDGVNLHLTTLNDENNLKGKTIAIDGKSPTIENIEISTNAENEENEENENVFNGKTYLREGRTLTVKVETSEYVYAYDIPDFKLKSGTSELSIPFKNISGSNIYFEKNISSNDINGELSYDSSCITDFTVIQDTAGNSLLPLEIDETSTNVIIDTIAPEKPQIKDSDDNELQSGEMGAITFKVISTEENLSLLEYSINGGNSFEEYPKDTEGKYIDKTVQLTARVTDYAGNVSDYVDIINLDIKTTFTKYILECTNPDGYYKAGDVLNFIVYFEEDVEIPAGSEAFITFNTDKKALLTEDSKGVTRDYANFTYTVKDTDSFSLLVLKEDVNLTGIKDSHNQTQGENYLEENYERSGIVCDGVAPTVESAIPNDGTAETPDYTADANNIYTTGNQIKITFSEPVQKGSGNIILRQTEGWAIPPVLTASEYNTICAQLEYEDKNILARQDENGKLEEDMEDTACGIKNRNNQYHGTGEFIGPYKKSMQGIKLENGNYVPDIDTKFVLDFDIGIWETTEEHPIGKTFENHAYKEPTETISAGEIRAVLEKAGLHQRVLDVTSANVKIEEDNKTVTITFPKGLIDQSDALPDGREWELVFEQGTFLDITGNEFGTQEEELIKINEKDSFYSDKVATPVVRVDRYSYGLGIRQANADGTLTAPIANDGVKPTGYVRVRIDCETKGATVVYSETKQSKNNENTPNDITYENEGSTDAWKTNDVAKSYCTTSNLVSYNDPTTTYTKIFAVGSGNYEASYKGIIAAKAKRDSFIDSLVGVEGVFQTVVFMNNPTRNDGNSSCADAGTNNTDVSIRGTTGFAGEPYISPFPLRDSRVGSPYLRIIFRESTQQGKTDSKDYYWISYEVLVDSSFSNYSWHKNGYYDWACNWGLMKPGEFTRVVEMTNWG